MIKKSIYGALIVCGLLMPLVSNAGYTQTVGLEQSPSIYDNQYDLTFLKGGAFLSNYLGQAKSILALQGGTLLWWTPNGQLYFQGPSFQGYFGQYASCDELTGLDSSPTNCSYTDITGDYKTLFINFFKNVKAGDYVYYDYKPYSSSAGSCRSSSYRINLCYSSSTIHKSLCFNRNYSCSCYGNCTDKGTLINSQNYNYTFATIPQSELGYAPGQAGYDGNWNEWTGGINSEETWSNNTIYCPTIKQVMSNYGSNYNTGLCYNSTLKFENGQIQTVEKKDIFTVFSGYEEYTSRLSIYQNQCETPNTQENCQNAFSGQREKYSIIANIWNAGVNRKNIWNYCNMGLNYDPNATTCVASGYYAEPPTPEEIMQGIEDGIEKVVNRPGTGNILEDLLGSGENRDDVDIYDIIGNFTQIKDKVSSIFNKRSGQQGIIPDYILRMIMCILLLTVLFKK